MISRRVFAVALLACTGSVVELRAAGIDGKWQAEVPGRDGPTPVTFDLKADGQALTGSVSAAMIGATEIQDGTVDGNAVSFVQVIARGQRQIRFKYEGKLAGDSLELTRTLVRPAGMAPARPGAGPGQGGGRAQGGPPRGGQAGGRGRGLAAPLTFTAKRIP